MEDNYRTRDVSAFGRRTTCDLTPRNATSNTATCTDLSLWCRQEDSAERWRSSSQQTRQSFSILHVEPARPGLTLKRRVHLMSSVWWVFLHLLKIGRITSIHYFTSTWSWIWPCLNSHSRCLGMFLYPRAESCSWISSSEKSRLSMIIFRRKQEARRWKQQKHITICITIKPV